MNPWAVEQLHLMGWTDGALRTGGLEEPITVSRRPNRLGLGALPPHINAYRTVMCRNVGEEERCPKGLSCTFAHCKEELREKIQYRRKEDPIIWITIDKAEYRQTPIRRRVRRRPRRFQHRQPRYRQSRYRNCRPRETYYRHHDDDYYY